MALTGDFRITVQARARRDAAFREGLLSEALEKFALGRCGSRERAPARTTSDATIGFPKLAVRTKTHVKTLHQMFGPKGNPTANKLFEIVAYLRRSEGVRYCRSGQAELRSAYNPQGALCQQTEWTHL